MLTIAITALVAPVATFALLQARVDLLLARYARTGVRLFYVADSGLEQALADLRLDPSFDRLLAGPDGREGTADDESFPFRRPCPSFFPNAPFRYEVTVEQRDADRVDIVSRGTGKGRGAQTVSTSVVRSTDPVIAGAICSAVAGPGFTLGEEFRVSGTDRTGEFEPVPALAVPDEEAADSVKERLDAEAAERLTGRGDAPSLAVGSIPDLERRAGALLADPRMRLAELDETGNLGNGLLLSRGALWIEQASGSGVLLVDGDLSVRESFTFEGLILVLGDVVFERDSLVEIHGGLVQGGGVTRLQMLGAGEIVYDGEVLRKLDAMFPGLLPRRAIVTGWREVWD